MVLVQKQLYCAGIILTTRKPRQQYTDCGVTAHASKKFGTGSSETRGHVCTTPSYIKSKIFDSVIADDKNYSRSWWPPLGLSGRHDITISLTPIRNLELRPDAWATNAYRNKRAGRSESSPWWRVCQLFLVLLGEPFVRPVLQRYSSPPPR